MIQLCYALLLVAGNLAGGQMIAEIFMTDMFVTRDALFAGFTQEVGFVGNIGFVIGHSGFFQARMTMEASCVIDI